MLPMNYPLKIDLSPKRCYNLGDKGVFMRKFDYSKLKEKKWGRWNIKLHFRNKRIQGKARAFFEPKAKSFR